MRVSTSQIFNNFIKYDNKRQAQLEKFSNKLSSGKRLLQPSTDPVDLAQSLRYKSINKDIEGYLKNINIIKSTQEIAESSLTNIMESGEEVRVELVHLLNTGVLDQDDADVIKDFLQGMRDYFADQANVKVGDKYIFSGTKSQTAPIDKATGKYQGNTLSSTVPVAKGVEEPIKFNGKEYLGVGTVDGEDKMILVAVLDKVIDVIESGNLSDLHKSDFINIDGQDYALLDGFDKGFNKVMQMISHLGSQRKTVDNIEIQHQAFKVNYESLISKLEDTDFAKTVADLERTKVAYEATMASYNQNKDLSLLNYIK